MSSSPIGKAIDSQFRGPEFETPKKLKKPLEPAESPFEPDLYTWDPRKKCHVTPDERSFFGMGLARRCSRCERVRDRETNQQFREWELDQFDKWVATRKPNLKPFDL